MIVKRALLEKEIVLVKDFLLANDLKYDQDITETYFIEEEGRVIASVSRSGYLIKALAVDQDYRGENLGALLVTEILNSMRLERIYYHQVFTKTEYAELFKSLTFRLIAETDKVAILEGGDGDIRAEINKMRSIIETHFGIDVKNADIGAIVVNCNPITKGHYQLITNSAEKHQYFLVLVVEEDQSMFSYEERFLLVKSALEPFDNILVMPSTKYIVSALTFPSYFLKTIDEAEKEHAKLDALIFKQYFMPILNIAKRYVGSETEPVMVAYNDLLQETLEDRLVLIKRYEQDGNVISASRVRKLIQENKLEAALKLVPEKTSDLLSRIVRQKHVN